MSVFRSQGIILSQKKIGEKEYLVRIFFREYGILDCIKKNKSREKPLDIGNLINCEIHKKEASKYPSIHTIKILSLFHGKNYAQIESYLKLSAKVQKDIPRGYPHFEIFSLFEHFLSSEARQTEQNILLLAIKIHSILHHLDLSHHSDETEKKILKFIESSTPETITRLGAISEITRKNLEIYL